jgi:Mrp family chromosome partitioning ATPase
MSVDVWASTSLLDGLILVVEWGATDRATVAEAVAELELTNGQIIGVLLNKVDPAAYSHVAQRPQALRGHSNRESMAAAETSSRGRGSARSAPPGNPKSAGGRS